MHSKAAQKPDHTNDEKLTDEELKQATGGATWNITVSDSELKVARLGRNPTNQGRSS